MDAWYPVIALAALVLVVLAQSVALCIMALMNRRIAGEAIDAILADKNLAAAGLIHDARERAMGKLAAKPVPRERRHLN